MKTILIKDIVLEQDFGADFIYLSISRNTDDVIKVKGEIRPNYGLTDVIKLIRYGISETYPGDVKAAQEIRTMGWMELNSEFTLVLDNSLTKYLQINQMSPIIQTLTTIVHGFNETPVKLGVSPNKGDPIVRMDILGDVYTLNVKKSQTIESQVREMLRKHVDNMNPVWVGLEFSEKEWETLMSCFTFILDESAAEYARSYNNPLTLWLSGKVVKNFAKEAAQNLRESYDEINCLTRVFEQIETAVKDCWNVDNQFNRSVVGKAYGHEVDLKVQHTLGNVYMYGYVHETRIRFLKTHSTIQIYLTPFGVPFNEDRCTKSFTVNDMDQARDYILALAK